MNAAKYFSFSVFIYRQCEVAPPSQKLMKLPRISIDVNAVSEAYLYRQTYGHGLGERVYHRYQEPHLLLLPWPGAADIHPSMVLRPSLRTCPFISSNCGDCHPLCYQALGLPWPASISISWTCSEASLYKTPPLLFKRVWWRSGTLTQSDTTVNFLKSEVSEFDKLCVRENSCSRYRIFLFVVFSASVCFPARHFIMLTLTSTCWATSPLALCFRG